MTSIPALLLSVLSLWLSGNWQTIDAPAPEWVRVPSGRLRPLFPPSADEQEISVNAVWLAKRPTTNAEYLWFVTTHPRWRRGRVSALFADSRYLQHWAGPTDLGDTPPHQPVTNVSWFSAKEYCAALSARLPTEAEWQHAAIASPTAADGRRDPIWSKQILEWYASPSHGPERDVGQSAPNYWGLQDMHGLVWEWVLDFNSTLVTSDSRNPRSTDKLTFCGAGAQAAGDPEDYASFMRTAFLGSLRANRVTRHLGFRCARDVREEEQ